MGPSKNAGRCDRSDGIPALEHLFQHKHARLARQGRLSDRSSLGSTGGLPCLAFLAVGAIEPGAMSVSGGGEQTAHQLGSEVKFYSGLQDSWKDGVQNQHHALCRSN